MTTDNKNDKLDTSETGRGRSRRLPKGKKRNALIAGAAAFLVLAAAGGIYVGMAGKYKNVFFPNTWINDMDVSGLTVEQVKGLIASGIDGYTLTFKERGGFEEQIRGQDIGLHPEFDGTLEKIVAEQQPLEWGLRYGQDDGYWIEAMMSYDREKLEEAVNGLDCFLEERMEEPKDAAMSEYIEGIGYQIVPEQPGSRADAKKVLDAAAEAILGLKEQIDLDEHDVYAKPRVTSESMELQAKLEKWNRYVHTTVTYRFGSRSEVLDGDTIHTWLSDDGQGGVLLDEEKVAEYVAGLAKTYNTAYKPKELKTSYGKTVTITGGNYGWRINQSAEAAALTQILRSGESQEREPVYSQTAASHDGNDYGDTYVEINLTAQHLYYYRNGEMVVQSDFVSGNASRGWSTPAGAYPLTYKQRNATLKGEGYATPVSYWMPFNGGIGMHDAGWRGSFGGSIYKTNGSHGCINLPPSVAKTIYETIASGMPVLCYHLDGTAKGSSTAAPAAPAETTAPAETPQAPEGTAAPQPEATAPEGTLPAETAPVETTPSAEAGGPQAESSPSVSENGTSAGPAPGTQAQPGGSTQSGTTTQPGTTAHPQVQETPGPAGTSASPNMSDGPGGTASEKDSGVVGGPGM